ncbi:GNAT family N-acetyltransferase [Shewanella electrodiphila]|uniref:GNAT family N-acetyltransferase n=1 Tax=Shewanella electrodiphila TaxID=934143 RepID=A0ABT0KTI5_9GAMM|nr:GNAT family N-acetyltransferase [Shewanella electrodiphila]MCL1046871.1 GNAT family N-acetyltransferase [Shewanella electrodiphila]
MTVITTERLTISLMTLNDADLLFELDQNPVVMKYINGGKKTTQQEIDEVFIPRLASYLNPVKDWGLWKVFLNDKQFAGWILIRPMGFFTESPEFNNIEIGWRFKQETWGKGVATESATAVIKHIVSHQQNVKKFSAIADKHNSASINIMVKLGMTYQKTIVHPDVDGEVDVVLYSMDSTQ